MARWMLGVRNAIGLTEATTGVADSATMDDGWEMRVRRAIVRVVYRIVPSVTKILVVQPSLAGSLAAYGVANYESKHYDFRSMV